MITAIIIGSIICSIMFLFFEDLPNPHKKNKLIRIILSVIAGIIFGSVFGALIFKIWTG